ncbi:hypothetical protein [Pseudomethylobacillus aquaticus]|uniref:hypothetical protein n=1 Tax=Pseudomethylobacillus aquaticus TaxID=2676064 RepID=UPI0011CE1C00|nr:hypothetical protein [Pseudomethylobacillus aquaticus]
MTQANMMLNIGAWKRVTPALHKHSLSAVLGLRLAMNVSVSQAEEARLVASKGLHFNRRHDDRAQNKSGW